MQACWDLIRRRDRVACVRLFPFPLSTKDARGHWAKNSRKVGAGEGRGIFHPQFNIYVSYIYIHLFILHGYVTNSQYDQLPVGLIAQLVEHCIGIAEVMGSNPVQA